MKCSLSRTSCDTLSGTMNAAVVELVGTSLSGVGNCDGGAAAAADDDDFAIDGAF